MKLAIILFMALHLQGQTQLQLPRIGASRDASGRIRAIYGIGGNFLTSAPIGGPVLSAGFSRLSSLIKSTDSVQVYRRDGTLLYERACADGPALFSFDMAGNPAFVYIQNSRMLLKWTGGEFNEVPVSIDGEVQSVAVSSSGDWTLVVNRNGQIMRVTASGVEEIFSADVTRVVLLPGGRTLTVASNEIRLGEKIFMTETTPVEIEWISDEWLQLSLAANQYALRVKQGREELFRLPEVQ